MAPNNRSRNKTSLSLKVKLGLLNSVDFLSGLTKNTKELNSILVRTTDTAKQVYDPNLFAELRDAAEALNDQQKELDAVWGDVEQDLGQLKVFPGIREQISDTVEYANRIQNVGKKAYYHGVINSQDLSKIDRNVKNVHMIQQSLTRSLQSLALLNRDMFATDTQYSLELQKLQEKVSRKTVELAKAKADLNQDSVADVNFQKGVDFLQNKARQDGTAAFFEGAEEASSAFIAGIKAAFDLDPEEANKQFNKAKGLGSALQFVSKKRKEQSLGEDSLSGPQKIVEGALSNFGVVIGRLSAVARYASLGMSIAGGVAIIFSMMMNAADKARELNKTLLSGRSLGELGLDLQAQADPAQAESIFKSLQSDFRDIYGTADSRFNKFKLSPEQAKQELAKYSDLNLSRATGNLQQGQNVISNLNKFVNMGIALQREWGISTEEVAQTSIELSNEFGYSEQELRSLYGGLARVSKGSNINVARLLGNVKGLAYQSPIFGDNLKSTAALFTKIYNTKILGTKDITTYIQTLTQVFQDDDSTQRVITTLMANKPQELISTLDKTLAAMPTGTEGQLRARNFVASAIQKIKDISSGKIQPTALDMADIAYALKLVPNQTKQALLAQAVFDKSTLEAKASDPNFDQALKMTMEEFSRAKVLTGDENALFNLRQTLIALAKANPNKTISELLSIALDDISSQSNKDTAEFNKIENYWASNADQLVPPMRGVTNTIEGFMMRLQSLAETVIDFIQKGLLNSTFTKWVAEKLGIAAPSLAGEDVNAQVASLVSEMTRLQAKAVGSSGPQRAEAVASFNAAAARLAELARVSPTNVKSALEGKSLNFTNYFTVTGQEGFPAYLRDQLDTEVQDALHRFILGQIPSGSTGVQVTPPPTPPLAPQPLNVPMLEQTRAVRQVNASGVTINIPEGVTKLSRAQQDILNMLERNPSDPRSLALEALRIKFGSSPLFAYILREFLTQAQTERDPNKLLLQVVGAVDKNKHTIQHGLLNYNRGNKAAIQKALDAGFRALREPIKPQLPPSAKGMRPATEGEIRRGQPDAPTSTSGPAPKAPTASESDMPWLSKAFRRLVSYIPGDLGKSARSSIASEERSRSRQPVASPALIPQRSQAATLATVTGNIDYKVRNVKLKVIETTTDVASMADRAVSIRLNEISQYYNITKKR